ncbi:D-alanyl-D-alanine carboxypeptidase [Paenibacillus sp. UNCCL117]|uniref:M15 family metallopeptidase n=1 Tax=unclassified Paenibacillus TaxID=185978 RepID=UPI00088CDA9B|nr:D-Ala-D-Ala carboxypeptidase. Metallo peptidase. MEROPS family M15B [Paenibacillus sp. cl123]SFW16865.1 D-alanyl-D-alanine carboxypeptidase [Paenibacillus sp. UNCCL117]
MKKWVFGIVILIGCSYYFSEIKPQAVEQQTEVIGEEAVSTIQITKDQVYKGNLLLVNKDYPVPPEARASIQAKAVTLSKHKKLTEGFVLLDNHIQLSADMAEKFSAMVAAARKDGVNHFILNSGYRNHEEQHELYEQQGAELAMPAGYSEHNLGLSLDIGSSLGKMMQAPEGKWLEENAWKYGFILRYPPDKVDITGIEHEPWHFRYVGLPHSAIMQEKNMVLEQYLDYVKKQKRMTITIGQRTYEVSYYPVTRKGGSTVNVKGPYEISGNNKDGVIVTSWTTKAAK